MNWFHDEYMITTNEEVYIPWLGRSLNKFWFEVEENEKWFTPHQENVYNEFLHFPNDFKQTFYNRIKKFIVESIESGEIQPAIIPDDLSKLIVWEETCGFIPMHCNSTDKFIFLLPELNIKLIDSQCNYEPEIVIKNGEIILIQEMRGLWMSEEWFTDYLKIKE